MCPECGGGLFYGAISVGPGSLSIGHDSPTTIGPSPEDLKRASEPVQNAIHQSKGVLEKILAVLLSRPVVPITVENARHKPASAPSATPEARGIKTFVALAYFLIATALIGAGLTQSVTWIPDIVEKRDEQVLHAEAYRLYRKSLAPLVKENGETDEAYTSRAKTQHDQLLAHQATEVGDKRTVRAYYEAIGGWLAISGLGMLLGMFSLVQLHMLQVAELTMAPANADGVRKIWNKLRSWILFWKK